MRSIAIPSVAFFGSSLFCALFTPSAFASTHQQAYIKASNTDLGDHFGTVAVSGNTLVVGAIGERSAAHTVGGDQLDNSLPYAGAAYVYQRARSTWAQHAYLKASNSSANAEFGSAVAISGDTLVVGAQGEAGRGAAYVFVRQGGAWTEQAYLVASQSSAGDRFGSAVAIDGDTIVVGARNEDSNATGVGGDGANDTASDSGAAYVFVRTGATWTQQAYLKASNTDPGDWFGCSVGIFGDTVVVGALGESGSGTGTGGDPNNDDATGAGAAYVFVRSGASWSQEAYVKASNTDVGDNFGASVAIFGSSMVVGAPRECSSSTGVNGFTNEFASVSGAAYVFDRSGSTWTQRAFLKASNTQQADLFGSSVTIHGDVIVVGAPNEDSAATGVGGNGADNSALDSGAAYVFVRTSDTWQQESYLKASNTDLGDSFSVSVAVSGNLVVVGATYEDSNTIGINQNQNDDNFHDAGAAYAFRVDAAHTGFCFGDGSGTACPCGNDAAAGSGTGCLNSLGAGAMLAAAGNASIADDTLVLQASGMPATSSVLYFQGSLQQNGGAGVAFGDGLRCAAGAIHRLGAKVNAAGASQYPGAGDSSISVRGANVSGASRAYQVWYRNSGAFCMPQTFNLSNGRWVHWTP